MTGSDGLIQAVAALAGADIAVAVEDTHAPAGSLWPKEAGAIARAIPARRAEFTAGRVAARQAMAALGLPMAAILVGPDRAPQWPPGLCGSIAHAGRVCVAVVARAKEIAGIGVDLEPALPLPADIWQTVLRPQERAALALLPAEQHGLLATRIFAAKEAAYKCQYPQSRILLGFDGLQITLMETGFTAIFTRDTRPFMAGDRLDGQFGQHDGLIIALVVQRKPQIP